MTNHPLIQLAKAGVASFAATRAMDPVTQVLYDRERPEARRREDMARSGKAAYDLAAEKAVEFSGVAFGETALKRLAQGFHWSAAIGATTAFALVRGRRKSFSVARGLGFGTAMFLVVDEGMNTLLGITPPPREFPWQAHARGLVGHLVFGLAAEATLSLLDGVESGLEVAIDRVGSDAAITIPEAVRHVA